MRKHAVVLEYKRCRGCTTCIKTCPTEAIRVRNGKAIILDERCIDCGKCVRVCPHKAIRSVGDCIKRLEDFDCCIALPEPALYGQFQHLNDINLVLNALLRIGFHRVFEVSRAAELISDYARQEALSLTEKVTPLISSSCPTVLRLIRMRFPRLIDHVSNTILPMELAASLARREAAQETGLPPERIGVFAIVPCSSKVTAAHSPEGFDSPVLDGAFAIRDIYLKLLSPMQDLCEEGRLAPLLSSGLTGVGWAACGGECAARSGQKCVAVDGVENVIRMLEEIEDGRIPEADFIELNACTQGCVGGCFTVENPYTTKMRLQDLMNTLPVSRNCFLAQGAERNILKFRRRPQFLPAFLLDADRGVAMEKQLQIQALESHLPGLHCGSCGAPSCHAFAEDVVLGRASEEDCIFKVRARMQSVADDADDYLPAPFRHQQPARPKESS